MGDQHADDNKKQPHDGKPDITLLAKSVDKIQVADPKEAKRATQDAIAQHPTHYWRVRESISRGWAKIKSTESTNLIMAFATVVIAVFTALTFWLVLNSSQDTQKIITAAQTQATAAKEISGAANDFTDSAYWMEEHMDDVATAMQDSVDTADRNTRTTIRNAEQSFRAEQRAWVGVLTTTESEGFTEKEAWRVKVVFFNSGRTPARNVQTSAMYVTSPVPLSEPAHENIKQLMFRPAQSIAPQGSYREAIGTDYPAEVNTPLQRLGQQVLISQYPLIKNKQLFLYYFGILKYDDGFGKQRETQYCISLANPDTKEAGFCDGFNDLN